MGDLRSARSGVERRGSLLLDRDLGEKEGEERLDDLERTYNAIWLLDEGEKGLYKVVGVALDSVCGYWVLVCVVVESHHIFVGVLSSDWDKSGASCSPAAARNRCDFAHRRGGAPPQAGTIVWEATQWQEIEEA